MLRGLRSFFFERTLPLPLTALFLFYGILLTTHWLPKHDTLDYFHYLHITLSGLLSSGELPLWSPHGLWGQDLHFSHLVFLSPVTQVVGLFLLPFKTFWENFHVVTIGHIIFLLEEVILLLGILRLSKQVIERKEVWVFIAVSAVGSCIWFSQRHFNFNLYYALPWSLALLIEGIQSGRSKYIIQSIFVLALTGVWGSGVYHFIYQGTVWVLFFALFSLSTDREQGWQISFQRGERLLCLTLVLVGVIVVSILVEGGLPIPANPGRSGAGAVGYATFLEYGPMPTLTTLSDLLNGLKPQTDNTLYVGALVVPLAVVALFSTLKKLQLCFLWALAILFLFSLGAQSFVAPLFYHLPGMDFFRHVGLTSSFLKILLLCISGFGLSSLLDRSHPEHPRLARVFLVVFGLTSLVTVLELCLENFYRYRAPLVVMTFICYWIFFIRAWVIREKAVSVPVLLLLVTVDVFSFRSVTYHEELTRTVAPEVWDLYSLKAPTFHLKRSEDLTQNASFRALSSHVYGDGSPSSKGLSKCLSGKALCPQVKGRTALYTTAESALDVDSCSPWFQPLSVLPATHRLHQTHRIGERPISGFVDHLPREYSAGFKKLIGCEFPKWQLFSTATLWSGEEKLSERVSSKNFAGDYLSVSREDFDAMEEELKQRESPSLTAGTLVQTGPVSDRSPLPAALPLENLQVKAFSPNQVRLNITNPSPATAWLYYADGWHSGWRATVNGKETPILKANGGFKAFVVPSGPSEIELRFCGITGQIPFLVMSLISVGFLGWCFGITKLQGFLLTDVRAKAFRRFFSTQNNFPPCNSARNSSTG